MHQVHHRNEPSRTVDDNVSVYTVPASCVSSSDDYKEIDDALASKAEYCPVCMTCEIRKEFTEKYCYAAQVSKSILRCIYNQSPDSSTRRCG